MVWGIMPWPAYRVKLSEDLLRCSYETELLGLKSVPMTVTYY